MKKQHSSIQVLAIGLSLLFGSLGTTVWAQPSLSAFPAKSGVAAVGPCSVYPVDLKTEYRIHPLGIDTPHPRFSWKLRPTDPMAHGQRQTAWQIAVAESEADLRAGRGWISPWVRSDQSHLVPYSGPALQSATRYFWRVRVKDEQGRISRWSEPTWFVTGILHSNEWTAQWIGTGVEFKERSGRSPQDNDIPDPWLRKDVILPSKPVRAYFHVASIGYHELYVNGRKVGDGVLNPCTTDHVHRARYLTYDIAPYLHAGKNTIGLWLGFSWSIYPSYRTPDKPAAPIVLAQGDVICADGSQIRVQTDGTWRWHPSPNTTLGTWRFRNFGGELYDARKEIPNWAQPDCDLRDWKPVRVYHPHLVLSAQQVQVNRPVVELRPVKIEKRGPDTWRVDFGRNFAGWIRVELTGQPGDRIDFYFSERENQEMTHRLHSACIIGPSGRAVFQNRFNYGVGQWVTIKGLRSPLKPEQIRGWLVRTDYDRTGWFRCSDPLLNRIYDTVLWTYQNLSLGGYVVDCPQRERMGYGGDGHATIEPGLDNFDTGALYTKWAEDWRDVQARPSESSEELKRRGAATKLVPGNLPYTAPTYWGGGGPAWSGFCVTLPWEMYRRHADRRLLEQMLPTIEAWLNYLETRAKDNLLQYQGERWFISDWLWPGARGINSGTRETLFFNNCYWVYNLLTAARIAEAVGRDDLAAKWRKRAEEVRKAIHREFYHDDPPSYVNNFQAYLSIALLTGIPPESIRPKIEKALEKEILQVRKGHFWGGITGGYFILKYLTTAGRNDLIYTMASKTDYPSWGDMLAKGATTFWEDWEGRLSRCHSSYLHIGLWFLQGLAGIQPGQDDRGFQTLELRPGWWPGCPIHWVRAAEETPWGRVQVAWRQKGSHLVMDVTIPPNMEATLFPPPGVVGPAQFDGKSAEQAEGVPPLPAEKNQPIRYHLTAGMYHIEFPINHE